MKIFSIFLILINLSDLCLADDAVYLEKGASTPFSGFLLSKDKALELRNNTLQRDEYKLLNDSLSRTVDFYKTNETSKDGKINTLLEQNDKLAVSLTDARSTTSWEKIGWFLGGVLVTSAAFYGATKLVK